MSAEVKQYDLVVTRVFDAPVAAVWNAWIAPELVMQWWGPTGFTSPSAAMDFRVGGTSLVCMRAPAEFGGQDYYNTWAYTEIIPHERFAFIQNFADKHGSRIDPTSVGLPPEAPQDVRNTVIFKDLGDGKTEMTVTEYGYTSGSMLEMSKLGLEQCLDKMAAALG